MDTLEHDGRRARAARRVCVQDGRRVPRPWPMATAAHSALPHAVHSHTLVPAQCLTPAAHATVCCNRVWATDGSYEYDKIVSVPANDPSATLHFGPPVELVHAGVTTFAAAMAASVNDYQPEVADRAAHRAPPHRAPAPHTVRSSRTVHLPSAHC